MDQRAPWVFAFVLVLAFVLLLISFRSVVIPATAVVLNILSVGAAYGVIVALFATMKLLGRWNWYLPRWLEWLPQISHETPPPPATQPPRQAVPAGRP